jgi:hypothetical protein
MAQGTVKWFNGDKDENDDETDRSRWIRWAPKRQYWINRPTKRQKADDDVSTPQASAAPEMHVDPEIIGDVVGAHGDSSIAKPRSMQSPPCPPVQ